MTVAKALFISDAHLGSRLPSYEHRESYLLSFLREQVSGISHLFIVGDLFDFWIEYKYAIRPDYFTVIHALRNLVETGTEVHYVAGNHDFALGDFLRSTLGLRVHLDSIDCVLQGKRLYVFHGDGILKDDVGYRVLRKVLRNPFYQRVYKLLHPNIGIPLAHTFSGSSRALLSVRITQKRLAEYRAAAKRKLDQGYDVAVFGHTHVPEISRWGGKTYVNTGNWIDRYTFARLDGGEISLWSYVPAKPPRPVAAAGDTNSGASAS